MFSSFIVLIDYDYYFVLFLWNDKYLAHSRLRWKCVDSPYSGLWYTSEADCACVCLNINQWECSSSKHGAHGCEYYMARCEKFVYISGLDKIHTSKEIIRSTIIIKFSLVGSQCKKIGYNIMGTYEFLPCNCW